MPKFIKIFIILGFLYLFIPITISQASTYYVSPNGNDANSGTMNSPWSTLGKINTFSFAPGDQILFQKGGTWTSSSMYGLNLTKSGTQSAPITFSAYGSGNNPIIKTTSIRYSRVININASYLIIENLHLMESNEAALFIESGTNNIVRNCEMNNAGMGVEVESENNLITQNYIHDVRMIVNTNNNGDDDYGATCVWIGKSNNEVSYNRMINCIGPSYDYGNDGSGIEFYGQITSGQIHHNLIDNTNCFIEAGGSGANGKTQNVSIYNNVVINAGEALHINLNNLFSTDMQNFTMYHNTFYIDTYASKAFNFTKGSVSGNQLIVKNNIFSGFSTLAPSLSFVHQYNLYDKSTSTLSTGELKVSNIGFVNTGNKDFHLLSTSAAVNNGTNLGILTDYDSKTRPYGAGYDIGAYEYGATSNSSPNPSPSSIATPVTTPSSSPTRCQPLGNIDCTDKVNALDFGYLFKYFGSNNYLSDLNNSGLVNGDDVKIWINNYLKIP